MTAFPYIKNMNRNIIRKVIFFGDSNTYGFDPREFSGGEYPREVIWTSIVAESLMDRFEVINEGLNGRRIPFPGRYEYVGSLLDSLGQDDIFAIMLGTNDILMTLDPDAERPVSCMDSFIKWILERNGHPKLLLIAPPCSGSETAADPLYRLFYQECDKMNEGFRSLAEQYNILFADASEWGIELAFDLGHFTEEGHRVFARHMVQVLNEV